MTADEPSGFRNQRIRIAAMNESARSVQIEANTARLVVQNQQIISLLERLLEVSGDQPDYSAVRNGNGEKK